jgi:hypothetical protein
MIQNYFSHGPFYCFGTIIGFIPELYLQISIDLIHFLVGMMYFLTVTPW